MSGLTKTAKQKLTGLEITITNGLETFVEVGEALSVIRDTTTVEGSNWWCEFESFDAYCKAKWGFNKQRASQLIKVADPELSTMVDNERQGRELAKVPSNRRKVVVNKAFKKSGDGETLTAPAIAEAAAEDATAQAAPPKPPKTPVDRFDVPIPEHVRDAFAQVPAFNEAMAQLQTLRSTVQEICDTGGGVHLNLTRIDTELKSAWRTLKAARPYCVCTCGAKTKRGCKQCKSQGHITQDIHTHAPKD